MKYLRTITFAWILVTAYSAGGQTEIDFQHKSLLTALNKAGIKSFGEIRELSMDDTTYSAINGKYFLIAHENKDLLKYIYVGRVNSCRAGGCAVSGNSAASNEFEYFDYYILFDSLKTVRQVKVFNYRATHGQEITSKGWLKQFVGHKTPEPLMVDKNVDSISGATISVYAITNDIEIRTDMLHQLSDKDL